MRISDWSSDVCSSDLLSGATYGPAAALLSELFPPRIRYSSMSIPYHIGTGYFGGFLPLVSQYVVARTGDPYAGLWYTFGVVAMALVVKIFGLSENRGRDFAATWEGRFTTGSGGETCRGRVG